MKKNLLKKSLLVLFAIMMGLGVIGSFDDSEQTHPENSSDSKEAASSNKLAYDTWWDIATPEDVLNEIRNGANVNERGGHFKFSVLALAINHNMPEHVIKAIIDAGADLNAPKSTVLNKRPVIFDVAEFGQVDLLRILIEAGANLNYQDDMGITPLMLAVANNRDQAIDMLVAAGADLNIKDKRGWNVLTYSNNNEMKKKLFDLGVDISGAYR